MASKFSGAVLALVLVPLVALAAWRESGPGVAAALRRAAPVLGVCALLAVLVIQASYFFSGDPLRWWDGLMRVNVDHDPTFPYYLAGEFRPGGFWYYFVLAFLIKTPLLTLLLLAATPFALRRSEFRRPLLDEAFLVLPAMAWLIATSALADNLGVRYLMPVYPLVWIGVSRLARGLPGRRWAQALAAALAVWYVAGAFLIYPDQLAYFNRLAGGAANGHRWLDDSNIDWGQDLKRLKRWTDEQGAGTIRLRYGRADAPQYYGIRALPVSDDDWIDPPPGLYAFGTHQLIRGELHARSQGLPTDWLNRYEPVARVGYSIWIFRIE
jgi:hypothetical protein